MSISARNIFNYDYVIVDYCMYSNWGYRKRTRIWTNKKDWEPKKCDGSGSCGNMVGKLHKNNLGNTERKLKTKGLSLTQQQRYRVPADLIFSLFLD